MAEEISTTLSDANPVKNAYPAKQPGARLSGIDALRAVAMLLGVLFHSLIAYRVQPLPTWPYDDRFHHWIFDFVYLFIHSFRMPLFFLIAGYFCRLLLYKTGEKEFIRHRMKRIVISFIISLVIILPFTIFPFLVYRYSLGNAGDWTATMKQSWQRLLHWNGMAHLWFLYYLIFYYVVAVAAARIKRSGVAASFVTKLTGFLRHHIAMSVVALMLVWLILLRSHELYLHVDTGILPGPVFLLFYAVFFAMGWLLHKMPDAFAWYTRYVNGFLATGVILSVILFLIEYNQLIQPGTMTWILVKGVAAVQIITLVYGVIGFFLRYFASAGEKWRYVSDASYWMYLIHLALIAGLQVIFIYLGITGILRFPLVLGITVIIALATYHYFVRFTIVGEYLHGKRERKALKSVKNIPQTGDFRPKSVEN